jgi:uncharacterized protein
MSRVENRQRAALETLNEEQLIPVIRASLAKNLADQGFRISEIARALKVTQPAVTQYLQGKRGTRRSEISSINTLVDPLAERVAQKIRSGLSIETVELLETARQIIVMNSGKSVMNRNMSEPRRGKLLELLRERLRLELDAAEKYLELANGTSEDYTKLLLRMIAADSIRHGDVVSQLTSWLETGGRFEGSLPSEELLKSMLSLEDKAGEASLTKSVEVDHPVARLLLRWIDIDEAKHEKIVAELITLTTKYRKARQKQSH